MDFQAEIEERRTKVVLTEHKILNVILVFILGI